MAEIIDFSIEINGVSHAVQSVEDLEEAFNRARTAFETGDLGGENLRRLEEDLNAVERAAERAGNEVRNGANNAGEGALAASEKVNLLRESFDGAGTAAEILSGNSDTVGKVVSTTMRVIGILNSAREVAENRVTASILRRLGVEKLQAASTRVMTAIQAAYNVVMSANPIGLVIAAIVALVGAFALLVNPIRNFINQFESVGDVVDATIAKLRDIGSVLTFGLIDDAATAAAKSNIESILESYDDLANASNQEISNQGRYINELKSRGATSKEIYEQELALIDLKIKRERETILELQRNYKNLNDDQKKSLNQMIENEKNFRSERRVLQNTYDQEERDRAEKAIQVAGEIRKKQAEDLKKVEEELQTNLTEIQQRGQEAQVYVVSKDYRDKVMKAYQDNIDIALEYKKREVEVMEIAEGTSRRQAIESLDAEFEQKLRKQTEYSSDVLTLIKELGAAQVQEEFTKGETLLSALNTYLMEELRAADKAGVTLQGQQEIRDRYKLYRYNISAETMLSRRKKEALDILLIEKKTADQLDTIRGLEFYRQLKDEIEVEKELQKNRLSMLRRGSKEYNEAVVEGQKRMEEITKIHEDRKTKFHDDAQRTILERQVNFNTQLRDIMDQHQTLVEAGQIINDEQSDKFSQERQAKNIAQTDKEIGDRLTLMKKLQEQIMLFDNNIQTQSLVKIGKFYKEYRKSISNEHETIFGDFLSAEVALEKALEGGAMGTDLMGYIEARDKAYQAVLEKSGQIQEEEFSRPSVLTKLQNMIIKHEQDIQDREDSRFQSLKERRTQNSEALISLRETLLQKELKLEENQTDHLGNEMSKRLDITQVYTEADISDVEDRIKALEDDNAAIEKELKYGTKLTSEEYEKRTGIRKAYTETEREATQTEQNLRQSLTQGIADRADAISGVMKGLMEITGQNSKRYKAMAIATSIIDTLSGIAKAIGSGPPPWSYVQAAGVGLVGFANVNKIRNSPTDRDSGENTGPGGLGDSSRGGTRFAAGGLLIGPGHNSGGIRTSFGELEGGEFVVNRRSTQKYAPLISAINMAGGGRKYDTGGVLGTDAMMTSLMRDIDQKSRVPLKTYVVASDMKTALEAETKIRYKTTL